MYGRGRHQTSGLAAIHSGGYSSLPSKSATSSRTRSARPSQAVAICASISRRGPFLMSLDSHVFGSLPPRQRAANGLGGRPPFPHPASFEAPAALARIPIRAPAARRIRTIDGPQINHGKQGIPGEALASEPIRNRADSRNLSDSRSWFPTTSTESVPRRYPFRGASSLAATSTRGRIGQRLDCGRKTRRPRRSARARPRPDTFRKGGPTR